MYLYLSSLLSNRIELSHKKSAFPQLRKMQILINYSFLRDV